MSRGHILFAVAFFFFFLAGMGVAVAYGTAIAWGLCSLSLGLLLSDVPLSRDN